MNLFEFLCLYDPDRLYGALQLYSRSIKGEEDDVFNSHCLHTLRNDCLQTPQMYAMRFLPFLTDSAFRHLFSGLDRAADRVTKYSAEVDEKRDPSSLNSVHNQITKDECTPIYAPHEFLSTQDSEGRTFPMYLMMYWRPWVLEVKWEYQKAQRRMENLLTSLLFIEDADEFLSSKVDLTHGRNMLHYACICVPLIPSQSSPMGENTHSMSLRHAVRRMYPQFYSDAMEVDLEDIFRYICEAAPTIVGQVDVYERVPFMYLLETWQCIQACRQFIFPPYEETGAVSLTTTACETLTKGNAVDPFFHTKAIDQSLQFALREDVLDTHLEGLLPENGGWVFDGLPALSRICHFLHRQRLSTRIVWKHTKKSVTDEGNEEVEAEHTTFSKADEEQNEEELQNDDALLLQQDVDGNTCFHLFVKMISFCLTRCTNVRKTGGEQGILLSLLEQKNRRVDPSHTSNFIQQTTSQVAYTLTSCLSVLRCVGYDINVYSHRNRYDVTPLGVLIPHLIDSQALYNRVFCHLVVVNVKGFARGMDTPCYIRPCTHQVSTGRQWCTPWAALCSALWKPSNQCRRLVFDIYRLLEKIPWAQWDAHDNCAFWTPTALLVERFYMCPGQRRNKYTSREIDQFKALRPYLRRLLRYLFREATHVYVQPNVFETRSNRRCPEKQPATVFQRILSEEFESPSLQNTLSELTEDPPKLGHSFIADALIRGGDWAYYVGQKDANESTLFAHQLYAAPHSVPHPVSFCFEEEEEEQESGKGKEKDGNNNDLETSDFNVSSWYFKDECLLCNGAYSEGTPCVGIYPSKQVIYCRYCAREFLSRLGAFRHERNEYAFRNLPDVHPDDVSGNFDPLKCPITRERVDCYVLVSTHPHFCVRPFIFVPFRISEEAIPSHHFHAPHCHFVCEGGHRGEEAPEVIPDASDKGDDRNISAAESDTKKRPREDSLPLSSSTTLKCQNTDITSPPL
jgi:hypothetical protein